MSTVAEIKEAISQLQEGQRRDLQEWLNGNGDPRRFTDDGFDVEETREKLQAAIRGSFQKWTEHDWQRLQDSVR